ncbi:hypothetical protein KUG47_02780 [Falsochrobactrum sp. TDYN1]|uniref:Uncharacterized protein n=1 Tax=Falsochrobactrum tianjinense TaxID=2706015 RepID=A0A949PLD0_9HYPH|nr:hypothetical protein [Falsochrobactrum sp. TDYN1]MBV2142420.1 hypothetical protein [Falsochrobactrum sp. TDYN1]
MYIDTSGYWHKAPERTRRSPNEALYVFFGIFLACLTVPAAIILWAIVSSITSTF